MQSNNLHAETFNLMLNNAKKMYNKIVSATSDEELCLMVEELKISYVELLSNLEFLTDIVKIVERYIKICAVSRKLCILLVNNIDEYTKYFMEYIKYNLQLLNLDDYMREETTFNTIIALSDDLGSLSNVYDIIPNDKPDDSKINTNDILDDIALEVVEWYAHINDDDIKNLAKDIMEKNNKIEPVDMTLDITEDKELLETYNFVDHPTHYNTYDIEVIEMMRRIWGDEKVADWCEITAFKYRMRVGSKPDNPIKQDLEKEQWYIAKAKELRNKK